MSEDKCNIKSRNVFTKGKLPPIFLKNGERVFRIGEKGSGIGRADKKIQDFETIRDECLEKKILFEDPDFPADQSSILLNDSEKEFKWQRPPDLADKPKLFVDGVSRFDIQQGELGDCWVLAAIANLTKHKLIFYQVVPDDQSFDWNYAGIFHFRFWQYGKWIDVVIDDRLPTFNGRLSFLKSSSHDEFWSALLEKAYAKLHGSYGALVGGKSYEAMEDFTGGVTELFKLNKEPTDKLFNIMLHSYERNSMMGCCMEKRDAFVGDETPEGLVTFHAYSINKVCSMEMDVCGKEKIVPMLRLRNPWGDETEWKGAWSDKSDEWKKISEEEKKRIGLVSAQDGEFWMSYKDFMANFTSLEICNLNPGSTELDGLPPNCLKEWDTKSFDGEWVKGISAGGCTNFIKTFWQNPQYSLVLDEPDEGENDCTVVIALMQKYRRLQKLEGMRNLSIGFTIYKHGPNDPKPLPENFLRNKNNKVASTPSFIASREVSCRFKLPPGSYCIIPSTHKPNDEASFLLRVFSGKKSSAEEYDEDIDFTEPDLSIQNVDLPNEKQLQEIYDGIAGPRGEIHWAKLKQILELVLEIEFSNDACRSMMAIVDIDDSGEMGFTEFVTLCSEITIWVAVFEKYSEVKEKKIPASHLRDAFRSAGYVLNNRILNILVLRYGTDDDFVLLNDFISCAMRLNTMIDNFIEKMTSPDTLCATFDLEEWIRWTVYS